MNISSFANSTYSGSNSSGSIYAGNLLMMRKPALKSTQEKVERQQKAQKQIDFFAAQKEKLKDMECSSLEEIAEKLGILHSYEEQIAAVKKQYNGEQMFHVLDEARELGEKIAEATEKSAPKTAEERKEEMVEEALGLDENKGMLDEMLDEVLEEVEQLQEEILDETVEELDEEELEEIDEADELDDTPLESNIEEAGMENASLEERIEEAVAEGVTDRALEELRIAQYLAKVDKLKEFYKPVDILI